MRFVEELVVDEFLPTFRSLLAEELGERGLTQNEIATLLGISQSAVSKYVHGDVERNDRLLESDRLRTLIDDLGEGLATGEMEPIEALIEAEVCIRDLEAGGVLADLHSDAVPELAEYDAVRTIHDPESRLRAASQVRSSVRRGLRIIRNTDGFAGLIPSVGSNLVECLPDARGIEDVAAVPGRLLDVRGQVAVPGQPEFGVSQHVAGVLLAARGHGSDARAALNLKYSETLLAALTDAGHVAAEFDAEADLEDAVGDAFASEPDAEVLYQRGGFGIEPIIYVVGPDAPSVAARIRETDTDA